VSPPQASDTEDGFDSYQNDEFESITLT